MEVENFKPIWILLFLYKFVIFCLCLDLDKVNIVDMKTYKP